MSESLVPEVAVALVHYPILDRQGQIVATNITNFDIHDIARACTVYGVSRYYLVHPQEEQLMFVARVLEHWRIGEGAHYNASRRRSLEIVKTARSLGELEQDWGPCQWVGTHARPTPAQRQLTCAELKKEIFSPQGPRICLVFGTGYGLTPEVMESMWILESLRGAPPRDFRHLSVRSAVSIYLDRILGPW